MATAHDVSGNLTLGGFALAPLARDPALGTPTYVYDLDAIAAETRALQGAFAGAPHLVAYAIKANSAGPIVRTVAGEGCGADVVSGAELAVALGCGISAEHIIFSGVAKADAEIDRAIGAGSRGIAAIQAESLEEILRIDARALAAGRIARVSLRINPGLDKESIGTHAHIATGHDEAKFGIPKEDVGAALAAVRAARHVELVGLAVHVGSQITSDAYLSAARALFDVTRSVRDVKTPLAFLDTGGGFSVDYGAGCSARPADVVRTTREAQKAADLDDLALHVEPGRALVAAHGVLLATVIQPKRASYGRWLMIDAGMNDLIRPALYQAFHRIVPLEVARATDAQGGSAGVLPARRPMGPRAKWRVVGPVCESSDDFGEHELPDPPPFAVAILDAGAYGYTMASRYNGRALPAEVFLRGGVVVSRTERRRAEDWAEERVGIGGEGAPRPSVRPI
jgi:diaminopimelate decarboxylase